MQLFLKMKEYNYHQYYKYYTSSSEVFLSPLNSNEYLVSASATLIEPPKIEEGEIQIFDVENKSWYIAKDLRGIYYNIFNGNSIYNENPFEIPKNSVAIKPPNNYTPENFFWNQQENVWEQLDLVYKLPSKEVENLNIVEKLNKLSISFGELKKLINDDNVFKLPEDENDKKQLKNLLEIDKILSDFDEKHDFDSLKIKLQKIEENIEQNNLKLNDLISNFNIFKNHFSKITLKISNVQDENILTNFGVSKLKVLRPIEIIELSTSFEDNNPILKSNEIGICLDSGERKFGNGSTPWNDLPYVSPTQRYRFLHSHEYWSDCNFILGEGIECYENDTGNLKVGNGFSTWDKLPYEEG